MSRDITHELLISRPLFVLADELRYVDAALKDPDLCNRRIAELRATTRERIAGVFDVIDSIGIPHRISSEVNRMVASGKYIQTRIRGFPSLDTNVELQGLESEITAFVDRLEGICADVQKVYEFGFFENKLRACMRSLYETARRVEAAEHGSEPRLQKSLARMIALLDKQIGTLEKEALRFRDFSVLAQMERKIADLIECMEHAVVDTETIRSSLQLSSDKTSCAGYHKQALHNAATFPEWESISRLLYALCDKLDAFRIKLQTQSLQGVLA